MISRRRIRPSFLFSALCTFMLNFSALALDLQTGRSLWLGAPESPPSVTPAVSLTKSGGTVEKSLELEFSGLQATEIQTDQGNFTRLSIPQTGVTTEPGHPELPVYRRELLLDSGGTYACRVTVLDEQSWSLRRLGLPLMPLPARRAVPKVPGALEAATLNIDPATYLSFSGDDSARLTEIGVSHEKKLFLLEVFPVVWDPAADSIILRSKMRIEILRTDSGVSLLDSSSTTLKETKGGADKRLLIISDDGLLAGLAGFISHKETLGWEVDAVSISDIGTTREAIQDHIYARYLLDDLRPSHLLLAGDSDTIPVWSGQGPYTPDTDLYYACMDGDADWLPDMAYGRFPARTQSQLSNMVQKVISYENAVTTLSGFVSNAAFAASSDNYSLTEGTHNAVIARHMDPRAYGSDKLYSYTYGATKTQVTAAVNAGRGLVTYSGHAYAHKWRDPAFEISDVYALTNEDMCPFVASFACDSGSFATTDECFAEAWLRVGENRGGVAVWASSQDSYWDEDDILEKCLYDAVFIDHQTVLGDVVSQAKRRYLAHYGTASETRQYFEQYNLLGDPTMSLVVLDGQSNGDQAQATRDLPDRALSAGEVFTVTVNLWVTNPTPSALILKEVLPTGWAVSNAMWNGSPMPPTFAGGEYKWLFGFGTPVPSGTLTYSTRADGSQGSVYVINGSVLYGSETVATIGDQDISLGAFADTDNDGMPDDWELQYGLSPTNAADASANWDDDALNNLQEYLADTNPTNGASSLYITDIQVQNGESVVSWQCGQNAVQYFECADNLISNDWQCLQIFSPPTGVTNSLTIINTPSAAQMYYRIRSAR